MYLGSPLECSSCYTTTGGISFVDFAAHMCDSGLGHKGKCMLYAAHLEREPAFVAPVLHRV